MHMLRVVHLEAQLVPQRTHNQLQDLPREPTKTLTRQQLSSPPWIASEYQVIDTLFIELYYDQDIIRFGTSHRGMFPDLSNFC